MELKASNLFAVILERRVYVHEVLLITLVLLLFCLNAITMVEFLLLSVPPHVQKNMTFACNLIDMKLLWF